MRVPEFASCQRRQVQQVNSLDGVTFSHNSHAHKHPKTKPYHFRSGVESTHGHKTTTFSPPTAGQAAPLNTFLLLVKCARSVVWFDSAHCRAEA